MAALTAIISFLSAWIGPIFSWLTARANGQTQVATAEIGAIQAANANKAQIIAIPGVRWVLFAMFAPCVLHLTGIVLGRMHLIAWDMMPLDDLERTILLSLVIYVPAAKLVSR